MLNVLRFSLHTTRRYQRKRLQSGLGDMVRSGQ